MRKLFLIMMTLVAFSWNLSAQTKSVSGTVVDAANNEPLIGATVMPIGGGQGAATDIDGNFSLTLPQNVKQVKVSYVGYKEQTVNVSPVMKIRLESSSSDLNEVVVVAYGTANKESLTGSVAVIGSREIEDRPVTSVTAALEGNAPGVMVNNSTGTPGSSPSIRIRGFNSFTSDAQSPLYVVDGMIYEGDIAALNPADIESMSVLKDAASCALYGSRGANGVVLVSTKKAKKAGAVEVTAQVRLGAYNRGLPFYDRLGANEWASVTLESIANGLVTNNPNLTYQDAINQQAPAFVGDVLQGTNVFNVKEGRFLFGYEGSDGQWVYDDKVRASVNSNYNDLDWWDIISQTGFRQEYNVNAAAATEKFNLFSSLGYLKENGYVLATDYERFSGRVTANYNPVSYFKTGVNLNMSYVKSEVGDVDPDNMETVSNPFHTQFYSPVQPYYSHDPETGEILRNPDGSPIWNTDPINGGNNIAWQMRLNKNNLSRVAIDGSAYATAVIPYGFELSVRGNLYRNIGKSMTYSNNIVGSQKGLGSLEQSTADSYTYTFRQELTWSHEYGLNHVDAFLSHQNYKTGIDQSYVTVTGQLLPDIYALSNFKNDADNPSRLSQGILDIASETYLARARYNYDQKYFLEASLSRDGSSRFAKDKRWGTFWSVGGSWILSKEKFLQNANWINFLKLRASYGTVGNDLAANYINYTDLYAPWSKGFVAVTLANPDLRWEATGSVDVALEGSLFNDRFNFSVGYFNKYNSDLIYKYALAGSTGLIPGSTGFGSNSYIIRNIGTMSNSGWELNFGVDIIRNREFTWDFNIDFTFMKNEIVRLPDGKDLPNASRFQGRSIYEHYVYDYAGVDQINGRSLFRMHRDSPDFMSYDPKNGNKMIPDDTKWNKAVQDAQNEGTYVEIDGVPYSYNSAHAGRILKGTALPTVFGSFSTGLHWKGINFGALFTYSLGGKIMDSNYQSLMSAGSVSAVHVDMLNSWKEMPEGMTADSPNRIDPNGIPQNNKTYIMYNGSDSSRWLVSGSYLTLKNINLSYDLPSKWMEAMKLQGINIGFSMDNVFIVAARKGLNPTYSFSGGQGAYYVPARTYTFQLAVKF